VGGTRPLEVTVDSEGPSFIRMPFITVGEAARLLRTTRRAVYALIDRGFIVKSVVRVGRRVLLKRESLLAEIEGMGR